MLYEITESINKKLLAQSKVTLCELQPEVGPGVWELEEDPEVPLVK